MEVHALPQVVPALSLSCQNQMQFLMPTRAWTWHPESVHEEQAFFVFFGVKI